MDPTEAIVEQYLKSRGFSNVEYEPDGNMPPDFLLDGRIAVEARRLNQHDESATKVKGLEETQIPLLQRMRALLETLGPPTMGTTWFVTFRFGRPLEPWKSLCPKIEQVLAAFRDDPQTNQTELKIGKSFSLSLVRASVAHESLYVLGGLIDRDSSGWLLPKMEKSLQFCIEEKTRKISPVRHKYNEWWLVLVDRIGYGLSEFEREIFRAHVNIPHDWDRVVLVNPLNPESAFEI